MDMVNKKVLRGRILAPWTNITGIIRLASLSFATSAIERLAYSHRDARSKDMYYMFLGCMGLGNRLIVKCLLFSQARIKRAGGKVWFYDEGKCSSTNVDSEHINGSSNHNL